MNIHIGIIPLLFILFMTSCNQTEKAIPPHIIPEPMQVETLSEEPFQVKDARIIIDDPGLKPVAVVLQNLLKNNLPIVNRADAGKIKSDIVFELDPHLDSLGNEGYFLRVDKNGIRIKSSGVEGMFYAVQTIRQLLPPEIENQPVSDIQIHPVRIIDKPRFNWRGMHLDVSRHFMPLDFIKKYIDYLAMHKLNVFHWHLVDGIGWRIEIKSHPELTDIGAWRVVKEGKKPWQDFEVWREGDEREKYGGFYTQEEIKEIVAYARERFITVVPEIELPGHSEVVFQCYPELICTDENNKPLRNIGVYCASNPGGYALLEDVLDEVLELFPSEYIHIGGDEVNKSNWEQCAKCTKLMQENDYTPHEVQSHFVNHFDNYLKDRGRKLIGWHEILEGDLSESASIMYWGGENGVPDALGKGHPAVLTTGSHLYFDHYQSLSKYEPTAFGGYSPLKKVYHYEPVPEGISQEAQDLILGVQANLWTEYVPKPEHAEYMTLPRMAALAEIAWQQEGAKNWPHFKQKMDYLIPRYDAMGINYAKSAWRPNIQFHLDTITRNLVVTLETGLLADIYYTTDGTEPDTLNGKRYTGPFELEQSGTVKAVAVKNGIPMVETESKEAVLHKARGVHVSVVPEPKGKYSALGAYTLVDANFGGNKWGNGKWLGILDSDFVTTMEFDEPTEISEVGFSCIEQTGAGIYFPAALKLEVSDDGINFTKLKSWESNRELPIERNAEIKTKIIRMEFDPRECTYLRINTTYQRVPDSGVFVFVDEIVVN